MVFKIKIMGFTAKVKKILDHKTWDIVMDKIKDKIANPYLNLINHRSSMMMQQLLIKKT